MLAGVWQNLRVDRFASAALAGVGVDWAALSAAALEPSGFAAQAFAHPILEQAASASLETVWDGDKLLMAVPSQSATGHDCSLQSDFTAGGLPEIDTARASEAVMAFLNARSRPFLFKAIPASGEFFDHLKTLSPRLQVMQRWQRAALHLSGDFESWMEDNFDHKRRKELKRLRNRLAEQGALTVETLNQSSALPGFLKALLELEAKGWKGARGTALQANAVKAQNFRDIAANLQAHGRLRFWQLSFNGKPIASLFGMVQGDVAWIVKIAFDETFAKYSPGVLLIIEATRALFGEGQIKLVDSCAIPDHPMINRIWRDRIEMVDVLVAPAHISALQFNLVKAGLAAHAALWARAKSAFHALTKRKKS